MPNPYWTLSQAVAWIAHRSEKAVGDVPLTQAELMLLDGNHEAIQKALADLWTALKTGGLTATGIGRGGEAHRRDEIPTELWQDLQPFLNVSFLASTEKLHRPGFNTGETFTEVTVASADVMSKWPVTPTTLRPGRKPTIDYSKFEREVHEWIFNYGMPDPKIDPQQRQSDLERHMLKWHGDTIRVSRNRELIKKAIRSYKPASLGE